MTRAMPIAQLSIWMPTIPMRQKFRHAAAERQVSEPLIVAIELRDGTVGYGETHPRTYVTGESMEDAVNSIRDVVVPGLIHLHPENFGEAIEAAATLPFTRTDGIPIPAARAAVEIALIDAYSRHFGRSIENIAGWLGDAALGAPGSSKTARFSGVVSGEDPATATRTIRKMRWIRLPHFKLKVGDADDGRRVESAVRVLGSGLRNGRITLRLDANSAWTPEAARQRLSDWEALPITCVEQPLPRDDFAAWAGLAAATNIPLMADESLVTFEDGKSLIENRAASWFNIRISKNGGIIPAMRLAALARRHGIQCQMGCMVGETSILSAAGRWFLQLVPGIEIAEGSFGKFLLEDDVVNRSLRFGWAGGWRQVTGPGLGIDVSTEKLEAFSSTRPLHIHF